MQANTADDVMPMYPMDPMETMAPMEPAFHGCSLRMAESGEYLLPGGDTVPA